METNDREQLLSDDEIRLRAISYTPPYVHVVQRTAQWACDFYEAKITSGELMVVKTCKMADEAGPKCMACGYAQDFMYVGMNFCPGCGAKIIG